MANFPLSHARDLEGLAFIGQGYEVAQYQLHGAVFAGRAPTVVSRFVKRWSERKIIAVERLNRTGINRLRLTAGGREFLVASGVRATDLFAPRRPTALKDLSHVLWINDLRVSIGRVSPRPDIIMPAWTLQRQLAPGPSVIPDLLCIWKPSASALFSGGALVSEVDLGGESIQGVLRPKLQRLQIQLAEWAVDSPSLAIILTSGERRAAAIERTRPAGNPAMVVLPLPTDDAGEERFQLLRDLFQEKINKLLQKPQPRGT